MEDGFLLFYTGETRRAVEMLADQDRRSREADETMLENLHRTKEIGLESRELLESGDLDRYAELMHEHWLNKRRRSEGMTTRGWTSSTSSRSTTVRWAASSSVPGGGGFLLVYSESPATIRAALTSRSRRGSVRVRLPGLLRHGIPVTPPNRCASE